MNSILGQIQLGNWELGSLGVVNSAATCHGAGHPKRALIYIGGAPAVFSAVPGFIELGKFELGAVPSAKFRAGQHFCSGFAVPSRRYKLPTLVGICEGDGHPIRTAHPNLGPLVAQGSGHPIRTLTGAFYFASLPAAGAGGPTRVLMPATPPSASGAGNPIRTLAPVLGQQVSCLTGPNPPDAEVSNYVY